MVSEKVAHARQSVRRHVTPQPRREGHRANSPSRPVESLAMDYVGQAGTGHLTRDKWPIWPEATGTPPVPEHPRFKDSAMPLARVSTPAILPSDESAPRVTANFPAECGMQHERPSGRSPSNGRTESNGKSTNRLTQDDVDEGGSPNTDKPAAAPMTSRNTSGQWPKAPPAEAVVRKQPDKTSLRISTDTEETNNLAASWIERDSRPRKEATTRERYTKDGGDPPAIKARLLPPITNTGVLTHSQTEKATPWRDETPTATETPPADPDTVKVNDTTRPAKSGGQPPGPRSQHSLDKGSGGESDSAWGARGHGEWSADPTNEPGKTVPMKRTGAAVATEETSRREASRPPADGRPALHPESTRENHSTPSGPLACNGLDQAYT